MMGTSLNLLIMESHAGVADEAAQLLEAEGHSVHRCHDDTGRPFPCVGVTDTHRCPIDGPLDAAVLVRRGVAPAPTPLEDGVPCALRAGVPVIEDGTDILDPYADFVTTRVGAGETVAQACERAIHEAVAPLERDVEAALVPFLESNGHQPGDCTVRLEPRGDLLRIHLLTDDLPSMLVSQLSVKAVDTVRAMQRAWPSIEVSTSERAAD